VEHDTTAVRRVLGASIRRHRLARGYTQSDIATRANVDVRHIRAIETGAGAPSLDVLVTLTDALETSFASLFQGVCFDDVAAVERAPRTKRGVAAGEAAESPSALVRRLGERTVETHIARQARDLGDLSRIARLSFTEVWGRAHGARSAKRETSAPAPAFTIRNDGPDLQLGTEVVRHGSRIVFRRVEAVTRDALIGAIALVEIDQPDVIGERLFVRSVAFEVALGWSFVGGTTGTTRRAAPSVGAWRAHALAVGTLG
jgi:transcriptional regulator with XRE-family HTH domain